MATVVRVTALIMVLSSAASAQTWQVALQRGDYQTAVRLLQPLAVESLLLVNSRHAEALQQLALMYAKGLGVSPDPILACGLAQTFSRAVELQPPSFNTMDEFNAWQAHLGNVQSRAQDQCAGLSAFDRESADHIACSTFGMPDETFPL